MEQVHKLAEQRLQVHRLLGQLQFHSMLPANPLRRMQPQVTLCRQQLIHCQQMQPLCAAIKPLAPWLQAAQISMVRFANLGYSAQQGVDVTFSAKRQSKALLELESVAFQFELISSFKDKTQLQMLDEAINATDAEMTGLIQAWRTGNEAELAAIMAQQAGDEDELLSKLLWQRNHTMSDKMLVMMQQQSDQQLFFVIGAGHLVGQQNIPDLLRQQGAQVQACWKYSCI